MNQYCYYTPVELAKAILTLVPSDVTVRSIVDICCGSWNFLQAAIDRYPAAAVVGVDIDANAQTYKTNHSMFYQMDGREYALKCHERSVTFDLVLSNPPFGALSNDSKKYNNNNQITIKKRYETEMLWANLSLMSEQSILVTILPSTFIEGATYSMARKWLSKHTSLLALIKLPPDTFASTLCTYALVLRRHSNCSPDACSPVLYNAYRDETSHWQITHQSLIHSADYVSGEWVIHRTQCISHETVAVIRGNISSQSFSQSGPLILHCSSIFGPSGWLPSYRHCHDAAITAKSKYVDKGDIIVNRIGKYAGCWCEYSGNACLISDCLIVIKAPSCKLITKLHMLSNKNNGRLPIKVQGLATQYITISDIRQLLYT